MELLNIETASDTIEILSYDNVDEFQYLDVLLKKKKICAQTTKNLSW